MRALKSDLRPVARFLYAGGIIFLLLGLFLSASGGRASAAGVTVSPRRWPLPNLGLVLVQQDIPTIQFDTGSLALCQFEAGPVTATGTYHLPPGKSARLQLTYYIVKPERTETEYIDAGVVSGDGTFSITRDWPGIPVPYSPDLIVEIHFGANLLNVNTGSPVVPSGAGLDYYWYPWVCTPTPNGGPSSTSTETVQPNTITPSATATSQSGVEDTFTPTVTVTATGQTVEDTFTPTVTATATGQAVEDTLTPTVTATATGQSGVEDTFTPSPTATATGQPGVEDTFTPSPTATATGQPGVEDTFTPTVTATATSIETGQPGVEDTFTPTVTATQTATVTVTATLTATMTATEVQSGVEDTFTPTPTNTLVPPTFTFTPTNTLVPPTLTFTPTNTLAPTFTFTPTLTLPLLPTITFTPSPTNTLAATSTFTPTAAATGLPNLTLEGVCSYRVENQQTWRITNSSPFPVEILWQATATGQTGTLSVGANNVIYLTTGGPPQNLRIYVGGLLVREISSSAPCLDYLELATACTADNQLAWMVFNNNPYPVNVFWTLDNLQTGSGALAASSAALVTTSSVGAHNLSLSWEYLPLGQRTLTLSTDMNSCVFTATPSLTPTATATNTALAQFGVVDTITPTFTATVAPQIAVESTFTATPTRLPTLGPPVITSTPILIPVTGIDLSPSGSLALIGRIFTNLGILFLGVALLLTGVLIRKH